MKVSGESAQNYDAVRFDSFSCVNAGILVEADTETGKVVWLDKTGNRCEKVLGNHMIALIRRSSYRRF